MLTFEPGDLVCPGDLPHRVVCRVLRTETIDIGGSPHQMQILKLEPLVGQRWHVGGTLIRRGDVVFPARAGDLWRASPPFRGQTRYPVPERRHWLTSDTPRPALIEMARAPVTQAAIGRSATGLPSG
jgi:hypothetical protein